LTLAATIEDRPGIPPSPGHVAALIRRIREERIPVVISEPWADQRLVELVAREGGARIARLASAVSATKEAGSYLDLFEHNVTTLARALR
jgi:ABC-type Zn uptake system ZnuABC Zn-binding protein ZnuA